METVRTMPSYQDIREVVERMAAECPGARPFADRLIARMDALESRRAVADRIAQTPNGA